MQSIVVVDEQSKGQCRLFLSQHVLLLPESTTCIKYALKCLKTTRHLLYILLSFVLIVSQMFPTMFNQQRNPHVYLRLTSRIEKMANETEFKVVSQNSETCRGSVHFTVVLNRVFFK